MDGKTRADIEHELKMLMVMLDAKKAEIIQVKSWLNDEDDETQKQRILKLIEGFEEQEFDLGAKIVALEEKLGQ